MFLRFRGVDTPVPGPGCRASFDSGTCRVRGIYMASTSPHVAPCRCHVDGAVEAGADAVALCSQIAHKTGVRIKCGPFLQCKRAVELGVLQVSVTSVSSCERTDPGPGFQQEVTELTELRPRGAYHGTRGWHGTRRQEDENRRPSAEL